MSEYQFDSQVVFTVDCTPPPHLIDEFHEICEDYYELSNYLFCYHSKQSAYWQLDEYCDNVPGLREFMKAHAQIDRYEPYGLGTGYELPDNDWPRFGWP